MGSGGSRYTTSTRAPYLSIEPRQPAQCIIAKELSKDPVRQSQPPRRLAVVFHRVSAREKSPVAIVDDL